MRNVLLVLALAAVCYGAWVVMRVDGEPPAPHSPEQQDDAALVNPEHRRMIERMGHKTATLSIRAQTSDGEFPAGLEVGYVLLNGSVRWRGAEDGKELFTDAPLGMLETAARATDYPETRQKCQVIAGVPNSVVILLKPGPEEE